MAFRLTLLAQLLYNSKTTHNQLAPRSFSPDVPDFDEVVLGRCHQPLAELVSVHGLPCDGGDPLRVRLDWRADHLPCSRVPNDDDAVLVGGGELGGVRAPGEAEDVVAMAGAGVLGQAGVDVPESDRRVAASRGEVLAVAREGDKEHGVSVTGHGVRAASHRPHPEDGKRLVRDLDNRLGGDGGGTGGGLRGQNVRSLDGVHEGGCYFDVFYGLSAGRHAGEVECIRRRLGFL